MVVRPATRGRSDVGACVSVQKKRLLGTEMAQSWEVELENVNKCNRNT